MTVGSSRVSLPSRWKLGLFLICALTDGCAGMVMFVVSRTLAEEHATDAYLGLIGACLSFSAGIGSVLGGWLADAWDSRVVFLTGIIFTCLSVPACGLIDPRLTVFLPAYCLLGVAIGFVYPPLVAWLNQGEDGHSNRRGVSQTLLLFCLAWNVGMLVGHRSAGLLFVEQRHLVTSVAFAVSLVNLAVAVIIVAWKPRTALISQQAILPAAVDLQQAALFKRLSWLANLGGMFGGSLVLHLLPSLAVSIGISADRHGELLAEWRVVVIATYFVMHFFTFWQYRFSTAIGSQLLAAAGLLVISQSESAYMLFVGLAMFGQLVGYNYFAGIFYSTAGSSQKGRALAAGIHEATLAGGMAVGTILGGQLGTAINQRIPYLMASVLLVVLLLAQVVLYLVVKRR